MVLTVLQIIPALGTGGAEQACVDIAAALVARGDRAIVVSSGGRRVPEVERAGATHILCAAASKNPIQILRNARWLARLIREHKIDIVHARSRAPAWSAYLACRRTKCAFVTTFHAAYKFSSALKKMYNRVMARADRIIAISPTIARHIVDSYGVAQKKICLVNRGIDVKAFDPAAVTHERRAAILRSWDVVVDAPLVLLPARLSPIKNHDLLIDAMAVLKEQGGEMPLLCFVGDDQGRTAYSKRLRARIDQMNLEKHIRLVGPCSDMPAALSMAALVVMPSKVPEGFGRVPVEAMAMGVPVIASNLGATRDTVADGVTGWLLPPDDVGAWAAQIAQVLAMRQAQRESMAKAARARVATQFAQETMITGTLAIYDELMRERKA